MVKVGFTEEVDVKTEGCQGRGVVMRVPSPANPKYLIRAFSPAGFSNGKHQIEVDESALLKPEVNGAAYAGLSRV